MRGLGDNIVKRRKKSLERGGGKGGMKVAALEGGSIHGSSLSASQKSSMKEETEQRKETLRREKGG